MVPLSGTHLTGFIKKKKNKLINKLKDILSLPAFGKIWKDMLVPKMVDIIQHKTNLAIFFGGKQ